MQHQFELLNAATSEGMTIVLLQASSTLSAFVNVQKKAHETIMKTFYKQGSQGLL